MDENRSAEQEKRKHDVKAVEASVKTMEDFTSPEVLYDTLISGIREVPSVHGSFHDREGIPHCL